MHFLETITIAKMSSLIKNKTCEGINRLWAPPQEGNFEEQNAKFVFF
jgi:hypothetical protein